MGEKECRFALCSSLYDIDRILLSQVLLHPTFCHSKTGHVFDNALTVQYLVGLLQNSSNLKSDHSGNFCKTTQRKAANISKIKI